ncbi:MAG: DUF4162 domain-containing protein, partial [Vicinamibacteria bacterium]
EGPRAVEALRDLPGVMDVALFGRALHVTVEDESHAVDALRERLQSRGIVVLENRRIVPSLEDVFVSKVREAGGAIVD